MTSIRQRLWRVACGVVLLACVETIPSVAAQGITARGVTERLFASTPDAPVDLSGQVLENLDLSGLDFKRAHLSKAKLFGADLSSANLSGADLRAANLNRVTLTRARLDNADLEGASLLRPSIFSTITGGIKDEAPSFRAANMRGIRMFGRFGQADFSGAVLTDATCQPFGKTGFIEEIWRTELSGANLSGADLERANLTHALLSFADLHGANLRDAVLRNADLTGADLTGADVTGADISGADLSDVRISGAIGLDKVKGLATAHNAEKLIR
jgi:uncharacterized protein YjbI with pentapeptide repeats